MSEIDRIEKGTIYFTHQKTRGKIKIEGTITRIEYLKDKNRKEYKVITLENANGKTKFNYFGVRMPIKGNKISGEGMCYGDKCRSIKTYRTLKGDETNGKRD